MKDAAIWLEVKSKHWLYLLILFSPTSSQLVSIFSKKSQITRLIGPDFASYLRRPAGWKQLCEILVEKKFLLLRNSYCQSGRDKVFGPLPPSPPSHHLCTIGKRNTGDGFLSSLYFNLIHFSTVAWPFIWGLLYFYLFFSFFFSFLCTSCGRWSRWEGW